MSERFGTCRPCQGNGEQVKKVKTELLKPAMPISDADSDAFKIPHGGRSWVDSVRWAAYPCPSCDGTGFSGDALEYPG